MPPMCACVTRQVVPFHRVSQHHGLPESEPQTFAGDGIHAAGSVANQRNVTRMDGAKRVHLRDCASLAAGELRASQALRQLRTILEHRIEERVVWTRCHRHDANFFASDRRYVGLRAASPINFDVIGPGAHAIVPPRGVALTLPDRRIQAAPTADPRAAAISAHYPT